jgi:hypothetical protein
MESFIIVSDTSFYMEQYWMPKESDFENLRYCLDNHEADSLFIRLVGSMGGTIKVNEDLDNRTLDFRKDSSGLYMLVDSEEVFHFPLKIYDRGFSIAYERIRPTEDGIGRRVILGHGEDPYDSDLPEPRRSFFRHVLDDHLMEIFFKGRIGLEFHSWWDEPHWKNWTVKKS